MNDKLLMPYHAMPKGEMFTAAYDTTSEIFWAISVLGVQRTER
jgi:hypothetical protein